MNLPAEMPLFTSRGFLKSVLSVAAQTPALANVYLARSIAPDLRESIWVAVSTMNQCRHCSFVHRRWAVHNKVSEAEIAALASLDLGRVENRRALAADYLLTWIQADFGSVPLEIRERFDAAFPSPQADKLRAVARVANLSNLTGNTFDALLLRLRGKAVAGSKLGDELLVSSAFVPIACVVVMAIAAVERETPLRTLKRFRALSTEMSVSSNV